MNTDMFFFNLDISIMQELQEKFKKEFEITSGKRLRSSTDMQFAFSYNYFVMSELEDFDSTTLFNELDTNMNRVLDPNEILVINLKLSLNEFSTKFTKASQMYTLDSDFESYLNLCKENTTDPINRDQFVSSCPELVKFLKERFWNSETVAKEGMRHKYKYEEVSAPDVKFLMIGGEPFDIEIKLNNLIRKPNKFICLNDNIDYKLNYEAVELKRLLGNFYSILFPLKSSFEKDL